MLLHYHCHCGVPHMPSVFCILFAKLLVVLNLASTSVSNLISAPCKSIFINSSLVKSRSPNSSQTVHRHSEVACEFSIIKSTSNMINYLTIVTGKSCARSRFEKVDKYFGVVNKLPFCFNNVGLYSRQNVSCINQLLSQRDCAVHVPVWVGPKWLLDFPKVPATPRTPLALTIFLPRCPLNDRRRAAYIFFKIGCLSSLFSCLSLARPRFLILLLLLMILPTLVPSFPVQWAVIWSGGVGQCNAAPAPNESI